MNKLILKNGLLGSSIVALLLLFITVYMKANPDKEVSMFIGYAGMLFAFSCVVLGIKQQRKAQNELITFGKAFTTGFWITLLISTGYVIVWLIILYNFFPNFAEHYTDMAIKKAGPDEIIQITEEMNSFKEMYKNPLIVTLLTYLEILPLGIVFSAISALILKKK